jgi:hypothetical protein
MSLKQRVFKLELQLKQKETTIEFVEYEEKIECLLFVNLVK